MAYEINININGDIDESASGVSKTTGSTADDKQAKFQKQLAKYVSSQTITPFIQEVKSQITSNVQLVTGSTEEQERLNFAMSAVQYGVNTYKNAQAGAVITTGLGLGGGLGVGIGLALTALKTGMDIMFNQYKIDLEKRIENYQLDQTRTRAGAAYNKSRRN